MVGNMRLRCSARNCLRAEEMDCTDGGASGGIGVERPLWLLAEVSMKEGGDPHASSDQMPGLRAP